MASDIAHVGSNCLMTPSAIFCACESGEAHREDEFDLVCEHASFKANDSLVPIEPLRFGAEVAAASSVV